MYVPCSPVFDLLKTAHFSILRGGWTATSASPFPAAFTWTRMEYALVLFVLLKYLCNSVIP